jgi:general secretion pathway protein L
MLIEFVTWYGRQMSGLLPSFAGRDAAGANALVAELERLPPAPLAVRLLVRRRNAETALGHFALDGAGLVAARAALAGRRLRDVVLRLPRGALLERSVGLPLAAEASLERVIHFEIDRYTPFAAEEVFWAAHVRTRDRVQGRLQAAITLVPRQAVQPVLEALAGLGLRVGLLEGDVAGGDERRLPVAPRDERRERRQRVRLVAAGTLAAVLAAAAVAVPFLRQSWAIDALDARIAALQPSLAEAETLRQRLTARQAGSDVVASEQLQVGDALQTIAALTQILPDDTFLTGLVLQKREVSIEGQSANAARLIGLLSGDPVIRNAAFAAPVTRNDTGSDLFSIKADVR